MKRVRKVIQLRLLRSAWLRPQLIASPMALLLLLGRRRHAFIGRIRTRHVYPVL